MLTADKAEEILGKTRSGHWRRHPGLFLEYFADANALISRGFCTGALARDRNHVPLGSAKHSRASRYCALGALERATPDFKDFKVCKTLLGHALGVLPSGRTSIASINDAKGGRATIRAAYANVCDVLSELASE